MSDIGKGRKSSRDVSTTMHLSPGCCLPCTHARYLSRESVSAQSSPTHTERHRKSGWADFRSSRGDDPEHRGDTKLPCAGNWWRQPTQSPQEPHGYSELDAHSLRSTGSVALSTIRSRS